MLSVLFLKYLLKYVPLLVFLNFLTAPFSFICDFESVIGGNSNNPWGFFLRSHSAIDSYASFYFLKLVVELLLQSEHLLVLTF